MIPTARAASTSEESLAHEVLGQPVPLRRTTTLKNRIAKAALSEVLAGKDGAPNGLHETLYRSWAEGGAGLLLTGNVMIDRNALGEPGNVVVEDERDIEALRRWAEAGTRNGAQLWMQINHPGKQAPKGLNAETVSPSVVAFKPDLQPFFAAPRELTHAEILLLIARFARTAGIAKQAGFSGVQIHGAHGYLVSQFLSPYHNRRTDRWGGSPLARRRFVLEVLAAIRKETGEDFPIGIKLNSADFQRGGFTQEESLETVQALAEAGIDLIEISGGTYEAPAMTGISQASEPPRESTRQREAYFLDFAEKVRRITTVPLMLTGGFRTASGMAEAVTDGAVDLVGIGRALALDPELPRLLLEGKAPRHDVHPIKTGIAVIDRVGQQEITWYERQIRRIASGRRPDPDESALKVFALDLLGVLRMRLRGRKRSGKRRAS